MWSARICLLHLFFLLGWTVALAQSPEPYVIRPADPAQIARQIDKLGVVGTVMYLAAHPDDENTRLISWFSRQKNLRTVYLSLTRGDGGQNLIGTEIGPGLGVLRTQELLAARRIDGGEQWFTRAIDFGYSKTAEETLSIWQKDEVLADVVYAIRKFRPDIIVNRFDHRTSGRTHGHHTASAQLSLEAYRLAGDPTAFPEQLETVSVWQPRRVYFNTSWWFYGSREAFAEADKSKMVSVDIGVYEPWTGYSNSEVAMRSRSQHRCQGFGARLYRGENLEYLELLEGEMPEDPHDPMGGLAQDWRRIPGGESIQAQILQLREEYDFRNPAASLLNLISLYQAMQAMPDHRWREQKLVEVAHLIAACSGLFAEWTTTQGQAPAGTTLSTQLEIVQRAGPPLYLTRLHAPGITWDSTLVQESLELNQPWEIEIMGELREDLPSTAPYWLTSPPEAGLFSVSELNLRGRPESRPANMLTITLQASPDGPSIPMQLPLAHKEIDPAYGERYQPFAVLPVATVSPAQPVALFPGAEARTITVDVQAGRDSFRGNLIVEVPSGWGAEPAQVPVFLALQGSRQQVEIQVSPPQMPSQAEIRFRLETDTQSLRQALQTIQYPHIPIQNVLTPSAMQVVRVDLRTGGTNIGYITGAGDKVPECLREAGYQVHLLEDAELTVDRLSDFDAVLVGIRAYNTRKPLVFAQPALEEYVKAGGTLVMQYNTNRRLVCNPSPIPLQLSRDRVTVESAPIRILAPDHPALQSPNRIQAEDFDGWVQERGLYFPDEWDPAYTPLLGAHDPGETEKQGMLLVAPYGDGHLVYTGLSFFRQLPAGVPGAYRLLANLLALAPQSRP